MARSRTWCYTLNNWTEEELTPLREKGRYNIVGKEVGENGTPHLQGYIYFSTDTSLKQLKKISPRAHWERAIGTPADNKTYCSKGGDFTEWGAIPQQGKRTDLEWTRELLNEPEPMKAVCNMMNYQCIRVAEKWLTYCEEKRDWKPYVEWYHGPSGSGKTKAANDKMPNAYTKSGPNKWWDGYDAHEDVILDDLRSSHIEFTELLMILDRYEKRIECKGGSRQLRAKRIIVTSIFSPEEMYRGMQERATHLEPMEQLIRRIDSEQKFCAEVAGNTEPQLIAPVVHQDPDWGPWDDDMSVIDWD